MLPPPRRHKFQHPSLPRATLYLRISLLVGNAVLDILNFASIESSDGTLVLGPGKVWSNGALEVGDRGTGRLPTNSRRGGLGGSGRHCYSQLDRG